MAKHIWGTQGPVELNNVYGLLTVIERAVNDKYDNAVWICRCGCGELVKVRGSNLRTQAYSCGCVKAKPEKYRK